MSEAHFHVHGPHDHEVEHAAHGRDPFAGRIAVMTAIFATLGAGMGYMAGATQNDALMFKNEAAIRRTEASDQWNFYQSKSSKQNLAELGASLASGADAGRYRTEVERYKSEKGDIEKDARKLEQQSKDAEKQSEVALHQHHRWAQSMTLIQVSIALAAITLLTRNRGLQYLSYASAAGAVVLAGLATLHI
ncbi:MAG TPA: DUF4337 domain-containing protein [Casimicrobiaceae bacterium]|jgi:hypothetical protein